MPIGNTFPIFSRLRTTTQIPILLSLKKLKSFGHLSNLLKKTRLGSMRSEKMEFLRQIQKKKPIYAIGSFNQPSHGKATLTRSLKGLIHSPPWGT